MNYIKLKNGFLIRLDTDEEIISSIIDLLSKENITSASVVGIGALKHVELGRYVLKDKKFISKTFTGEFEIVSLIGNITNKNNNQKNIHLHISLANSDFELFGGHLVRGIVSATMEIFIYLENKIINRKFNKKTGLNIIESAEEI